jgi:AraC-like DNA-binding protein
MNAPLDRSGRGTTGGMYTISDAALQRLASDLRAASIDPAPIFAAVGAPLVASPQVRHAWSLMMSVKAEAARQTGDLSVGLRLATQSDLREMDVLGVLVAHQPTVGDALRAFIEHQAVWQVGPVTTLEVDGDLAVLRYFSPPEGDPTGAAVDVQQSLAAYIRHATSLTGRRLALRNVSFTQARPRDVSAFVEVFGRVPMTFSAEADLLVFDASFLALPVRGADPSVTPFLAQLAAEVGTALPTTSLLEQVRQAVLLELPQVASVEDVARRLGMSRRTLARRLAEEDTSFRGVVDETRRGMAERLVSQDDLALAEIAWRLGFSSPSSFHRAFVRWFGQTPGNYRAG